MPKVSRGNFKHGGHPLFKLGKSEAKHDTRNIKFASFMNPVPIPPSYDFDLLHPGIPTPMFANDSLGCCVIAGRAHQTLRFELIEQGSPCAITDKDVIKEYTKETGGPDSGLVVLDSLKAWRKSGWKVGKRTYHIKAFAEVNRAWNGEVQRAILSNLGIGLGLNLPLSAQAQTTAGRPWDVVPGVHDSAPGSWGGHYVYVPGYTELGPVCVTWGRKQQMTWRFFDAYCDEAYLIVDAKDRSRVINSKALDKELAKAIKF